MDQKNDQNSKKDLNSSQNPTNTDDKTNQKTDVQNTKEKTDGDASPTTGKKNLKQKKNKRNGGKKNLFDNDLTDDSDSFTDYPSISTILSNNEINFPSNPTRLSELQILAAIVAEPIHNNALLMVEKREDILPTLALFEKIYQLTDNKKTPLSLINFTLSTETPSFEDTQKEKAILNALIEDVQDRKCIPVLTDIMALANAYELTHEVDALLSQPQSVICVLSKDDEKEFQKIIDEEKEFQSSFVLVHSITPKTAFSSFTKMAVSPLSLKETQAILENYKNQVLKPNGIFSNRAAKSVLHLGYKTFTDKNNLHEIQKVFRLLSVTQKANNIHSITQGEVYKFFNENFQQTQNNLVLQCESLLNKKVLGQTEAIHQISELIQAKEFSLTEEKQPTVMGFFGPSGVGKTATAEALGPILSGQESVLINMSEFQEPHSISKLISSPPGYVGSEHPGLLHKTISQNPKAVFILDEFEKANESIHKLFLGIFDKGIAHDTAAGSVDLSQATFILTSNAGIRENAGLGFGENSGKISYVADEKEIEHAFAPEFMGRLQSRILFKPISQETLNQIIDLLLEPAQQKLKKQFNIQLSLADSARAQLVREGANPRYGARPLKNLIKTKILTPLTLKLLQNKLALKSDIVVSFDAKQTQYLFEPSQQIIQRHNNTILPNNHSKIRE